MLLPCVCRDQADVQKCHQRSYVLWRKSEWGQMLNADILHSAMEGNPSIRTGVGLRMQSAVQCYAYPRKPQNQQRGNLMDENILKS